MCGSEGEENVKLAACKDTRQERIVKMSEAACKDTRQKRIVKMSEAACTDTIQGKTE